MQGQARTDEESLNKGRIRLPKMAKVKNKAPAPVQITAEQLLREAKERELELAPPPPKQKIISQEELEDQKMRRRKVFEDSIRKNRTTMSNWFKYAAYEDNMKEIERARSIYERAIDVDHRCIQIWLRYAEMEMRNKQVNHARNVWDRAVTLLPRAQQLWYKYAYMEEILGNVTACRSTFERWMDWEPDPQAWHSYINFEYRYKEYDRARAVYERFILCHPEVKNWIKYAKWEERLGAVEKARGVYERAIEFYGDDFLSEELFIHFARFEERQREYERCRCIFKYAIDNLPKEAQAELFKYFSQFEKRFGSRQSVEDIVWNKRRTKYEQKLAGSPEDYDTWFDYLRMVEAEGDSDIIRDTYERAVANIPESSNKNDWRRYIYLWIMYALFEETEMGDIERTREVWKACLEILPHKKLTFAKIWIYFAHFEIRQHNLGDARKILGAAIGKSPKDKLFREYIELELQLREFDRCRKLYEKFLEFAPANCSTWIKFAELETILGDPDRARAIFELAITQSQLDMPEVLWKTFIDFEIDLQELENARNLYRRLLGRTNHPKVWLAFAKFEEDQVDEETNDFHAVRDVYREATDRLKELGAEKIERLMILEQWLEFEKKMNDEPNLNYVKSQMPRRVKKRRQLETETGADAGWEEYWDYIFPEDEVAKPNLKLLEMAKKWKKKEDSDAEDDDD